MKKLHVVDGATPNGGPPGKLGEAGLSLWNRLNASYDIPDEAGREMLFRACLASDRAAAMRACIDSDGELVRIKGGGAKEHPLIKHELASNSFIVRTLQKLGFDVESVQAEGSPGFGGKWRP